MKPKILIIREGTWLVCPECKQKLATFAHDAFTGMEIKASMFQDPVNGMDLSPGAYTVTPCCGVSWTYMGKLSTDLGWLPDDRDEMN